MKKYQVLARQLEEDIASGLLQQGMLLPSLRQMVQQTGFSKNTVLKAYSELENSKLIEPEERRGYRVKARGRAAPSFEKLKPKSVSLGATPLQVLASASMENWVPFGSAHPAIRYPACRKFYKVMARESYRFAASNKTNSHYTQPPGHSRLRERIAELLKAADHSPDQNQLVITNGAQEAITLALHAVASRGDIIAVESPCFYGNLSCIEALGMKVLEIPAISHTGIDLTALEQALHEWPVKALLLNPNCNNPQGFIMPEARKRQMLEITEQYDLPIIEDDTFAELYYSKKPVPLKVFEQQLWCRNEEHSRVLSCGSFSKTLHSDIRLGWILSGRYFEKINYLKFVMTMASPGIVQHTMAKFLEDPDYARHLRRIRNDYRKRSQIFADVVNTDWPSVYETGSPEGSYLQWFQFPGTVDSEQLFHEANSHKISITPGHLFSASGKFRNCIRMNFSTFELTTEYIDAVRQMGKLIKRQLTKGT